MTGEVSAQRLKTLNGRLRHLYDAFKIPDGLSNRLRSGAACLSWVGGDKDEGHILSESDFAGCDPNEFDRYDSPVSCTLENKAKSAQHVGKWRTNAANVARISPASYGGEYLDALPQRIEHLRRPHIDFPRKCASVFV